MDTQAIDRAVSRAVLRCIHNGVRFYIADNASETATDDPARAKVYRDRTDAFLASLRLRQEFGPAFPWEPECLIVAWAESGEHPNAHPDEWERA